MQKQGEAMKRQRSHGNGPVDIGTIVLIQVDPVDRSKTDPHHIPGIVVELTDHGYYRIACSGGLLKNCYAREHFMVETNQSPEAHDLQNLTEMWPAMKKISVRQALQCISPTGGQGFTKCGCKGDCLKSNCKCFKGGLQCNSRCHPGSGKCKNCYVETI
jgi:hypothetical protein